jgi:hypothetical protein
MPIPVRNTVATVRVMYGWNGTSGTKRSHRNGPIRTSSTEQASDEAMRKRKSEPRSRRRSRSEWQSK